MKRPIFWPVCCCALFLLIAHFDTIAQDQAQVDSLLRRIASPISDQEKLDTYVKLGRLHINTDTAKVLEYTEQAWELAASAQNNIAKTDILNIRGSMLIELAAYTRASVQLEEALNLATDLNYYKGITDAKLGLARIKRSKGKYKEALGLLDEALAALNQSEEPRDYVPVYNNTALNFYLLGNLDKAIEQFEKCIAICLQQGTDSKLGRVYMNTGVMYIEKELPEIGLNYYRKALGIQKKYNQKNNMAGTLNNIGVAHKNLGNADSALYYYRQSMKLNLEQGLKGRIIQNYSNIGAVYSDRNEYDSSDYYALKAIQLYEEIEDKYNAGIAYRNLGHDYYNRSNYPQALEYYLIALRYARTIEAKLLEGEFLNAIGKVHEVQGQTETALQHYRQAAAISEAVGDQYNIAEALTNIGMLHHNLEQLDSSIFYQERALAINQETNYPYGICENHLNLGLSLTLLNQTSEAENHLRKSLQISQQNGLQGQEATALLALGELAFKQNKPQQSLSFLEKGVGLAQEISNQQLEKEGRAALVRLHQKRGEYKPALAHQLAIAQLQDSIFNDNNTRKIMRLEASYAFEMAKDSIRFANEKEKLMLDQKIQTERTNTLIVAIVLAVVTALLFLLYFFYQNRIRTNKKLQELNESITIRNEEITQQRNQLDLANKKLTELNEEKKKILAVVAHDLRNPVQLIKGFISMVKTRASDRLGAEMEFVDYSLEATDRLSNMIAELLDVSAMESKSVDVRLKPVIINDLLRQLAINFSLSAAEKNQKVTAELPKQELIIDADPNYLIRILENLISNALKFSEPNTQVQLALEHKNQEVLISITDDGPGISPEDQARLFDEFRQLTAKATANEKSTGLGLSIVKKYVEAMYGQITCKSELGKGTTFTLQFARG
ncbi:tetratricopeptide repeat protein [Marinoscillum furvescens]|uniref:histidine kinase n=1 Tax=Marinoscillum furvescens DSM 4134 TaxID=1122208 RepID=A0A3D9L4X7_MARFU|nr:tetratricopeptide repeat protein [Marinoscillum furvescens]REE01073.1 signal transduction histidine kinase [Marinoscillum furvescens DSM 4134]